MANSASTAVTNFVNNAAYKTPKQEAGVNEKVVTGRSVVNLGANDEHGLVLLPANAIVTGSTIGSTDMNVTVDVGIYEADRTSVTTTPTAIDPDGLADAVAFNSEVVDANYVGTGAEANVGKKLFEIAGLAAVDPLKPLYEVAVVATAVTDGAGTLTWILRYVEP